MSVFRKVLLISLLLSLIVAPTALAQDEEPLMVGAVFNASGWMAAYDQPPYQGAQIAIAELNEAGGILGRQIELVVLDGETDPATVGTAAQQLIDQGAEIIITPSDFDIGGPASTAAQEAGLVGISPGASSPLFGSLALGDKQFTVAAWTNYGSAGAAEWAVKTQEWMSAYVITDTSIDYSASQGDYFISAFEAYGGEVVGEDTFVQGSGADFSGQLQRLQDLEAEPDMIFIASYVPDVGALIREIRALGIETPIVGGDAYDTTELYEVLGEEFGNDVYFSTHSWMGEETGEAMVSFIEAYEEEFDAAPDNSFIALGYDAMMIAAMAIEEAGTTEGDAVAEAMRSLEYDLLSGMLSWGDVESGHETVKEVFIIEVQGGEPSFVMRVLPEIVPEP